jgi:membrane protein
MRICLTNIRWGNISGEPIAILPKPTVMKPRDLLILIKHTFKEWSEDKASRLAAALAYYTSFSLAPLLVLIIAIAGLVGVGENVHSLIITQMSDLLGESGAQLISGMIQSASEKSTGFIAVIIGLITLLFGALGVFGELQSALNTIWEIKLKPVKGLGATLKHYVMKRILSFAMLLVIVFLLLVSLVISAGLSAFNEFLGNMLPMPEIALQIINLTFSIGLVTLLFSLIFKYLPDAEIQWRDVLWGALVTAVLFSLGKFAIGLYLGKSDVSSSFGAAGSLALLLIWVYYSSQILFLGAEFTQVYANHYGSKVVPEVGAVSLTEEEKIEQGVER